MNIDGKWKKMDLEQKDVELWNDAALQKQVMLQDGTVLRKDKVCQGDTVLQNNIGVQNGVISRNDAAMQNAMVSQNDAAMQAKESVPGQNERMASGYLIAREEGVEARQKELLYEVLGPVFFGRKAAVNRRELMELFRVRYGIDVQNDFYEGDEHYEEYQEAQKAIAEGMMIYGGEIVFEDSILAELAEQIWESMEKADEKGFRRINTMLEE